MGFSRRLLHPNFTTPLDCLDCKSTLFPQFSEPPPSSPSHGLSPVTVVLISALLGSFLCVTSLTIILKHWWNRRFSTTPPPDRLSDDDSDTGPDDTNYIWYIRSVGLEDSLINSIAVCKYKQGDGLIEETKCSVCLNEFRDSENLRLLPKCNHAFHVACIDTWLKSHANCPLCRARVVSHTRNSSISVSSSYSSERQEQNSVPLSQNSTCTCDLDPRRLQGNLNGEGLRAASSRRLNFGKWVLEIGRSPQSSQPASEVMACGGLQPVRRSASMNSIASSAIFLSVSDVSMIASDDQKVIQCESSTVRERDGGLSCRQNQHLLRVMCKSPVFKPPISLTRSFSSGAKFYSVFTRKRNSIFPL